MAKSIYILLEFHGQNLSEQSVEILAAIQRIAKDCSITAIVPQAKAEQVLKLPVDTVYYGGNDFPLFASKWAQAAALLEQADLVIAPMSVNGRDFGAAFAAAKNITYVSAVCDLRINEEGILLKRITYGGLAQEEAVIETPLVLGLAPGVWGAGSHSTGNPELKQLPLPEATYATKIEVERIYTADWKEMEINEGDLVIAGGMGMGNLENFSKLYELGEALSAPVGGSRVAEDKGWIEHRQMIGATGQTIQPKLYIACGISGAVQHTIGIQGSRHIIAINNDATASMMSGADLAVSSNATGTIEELSKLLKDYSPVKEG